MYRNILLTIDPADPSLRVIRLPHLLKFAQLQDRGLKSNE